MSSVTITSGRAILYRMFDIAEDIELTRISELLQAEVNVRRSHFLEILIIVLILYEILSAALG